jgi:hypothetical protein
MEVPSSQISEPRRGRLYKAISATLSSMRDGIRTLSSYPREPVQTTRILNLAQAAIRHCSNVRQLTIVLHDLSVSEHFTMFLEFSWTSLAGNLRKLTLNVTLAKLSLLLKPGVSCNLAALEELEVSLVYSRFPCHNSQEIIKDVLLPFTTSLNNTLRSLTISSSLPVDWSPYLRALGYFPLLRKLALIVTISSVTLSEPFALTRMIGTHHETLTHIVIRKNDGYSFHNPPDSDSSYRLWVTDEFSTMTLPALQALEIWLWPDLRWRLPLSLSIIPHSSCLTSLRIADSVLYDSQVEAILNCLHLGPDGVNCLQDLRLSVLYLHPQLVDLLAAKLPRLKSLDLTFEHLAASTDFNAPRRVYVSLIF